MTAPRPDTAELPWATDRPVLPLLPLEGARRASPGLGAEQVDLYRSLANTPRLLDAWIDWASALRSQCATPRALRELMVLRTAVVMRSEYEWHQHVAMAVAAGVPAEQVAAISAWQSSELFDAPQRAALMLTDAMLTGLVPTTVPFDHRAVRPPCRSTTVPFDARTRVLALTCRHRVVDGPQTGGGDAHRPVPTASSSPPCRAGCPGGSAGSH